MQQKTFKVTDISDLETIAKWIIEASLSVGKPEDEAILVTVSVNEYREGT